MLVLDLEVRGGLGLGLKSGLDTPGYEMPYTKRLDIKCLEAQLSHATTHEGMAYTQKTKELCQINFKNYKNLNQHAVPHHWYNGSARMHNRT